MRVDVKFRSVAYTFVFMTGGIARAGGQVETEAAKKTIEHAYHEVSKIMDQKNNAIKTNADEEESKNKLVIISYGEPTDGDLEDAEKLIDDMKRARGDNNLVVLCVFISNKSIGNSNSWNLFSMFNLFGNNNNNNNNQQLYNKKENNWCKGAESMFKMASTISTSTPEILILEETFGWRLPYAGNECKLFAHVNSEDIIKQFRVIINDIYTSCKIEKALIDLIGNYYLRRNIFDQYKNYEKNARVYGIHLKHFLKI